MSGDMSWMSSDMSCMSSDVSCMSGNVSCMSSDVSSRLALSIAICAIGETVFYLAKIN